MDTLRGSTRRPLPSPPTASTTSSTTRPPLGPRLLSEERRPSAFSDQSQQQQQGAAVGQVQQQVSEELALRRNRSLQGQGQGQGPRGERAPGGATRVEADFTTTFPSQSQQRSTPSASRSTAAQGRGQQPQSSSVGVGAPHSASRSATGLSPSVSPDGPLIRSSSLPSASTPSSSAGTNLPTPSPAGAAPSRSRQASTTSSVAVPAAAPSPSPAATPAPRVPSSSSRRTEAVLPSAPNVTRAPPTGMYWSRTPVSGRVPRGMRAHSAALVPAEAGRRRTGAGEAVWVFGGCDIRGACFKDVWRLDCETFIWTKPRVAGQIPPVTRAHTCTVVDGRLYIFGGGDGPHYYNDLYVFDTLSHTWSKPTIAGTPPSRRRAHTAVYQSSHGRILIFGGGNGANALNDLHALDVSAGEEGLKWERLETNGAKGRPTARGYHSMDLVGSRAVVFGGSDGTECFSDVWVLDLETLTWYPISSPSPSTTMNFLSSDSGDTSFPRLSHTSTTVGSYLFIVGGHDGVSFSSDVLMYNLVTHAFEPPALLHGSPPSPRGYHATILSDSRILVFGGFNGQQVFDEVWTLDLGGSAFLPQITNFVVGFGDEG